mmetsp:Transcript_51760/g.124000  ORF Transcript_51760/g.124000 Transcript_51760/m.124000 type:complete len:221 (+) Transcript_51760:418-1080(+)
MNSALFKTSSADVKRHHRPSAEPRRPWPSKSAWICSRSLPEISKRVRTAGDFFNPINNSFLVSFPSPFLSTKLKIWPSWATWRSVKYPGPGPRSPPAMLLCSTDFTDRKDPTFKGDAGCPCASSVSTLASVVELLKVFAMIGASLEALVVPVPWVPCVPVVPLTAPGSKTSPVCGDKAADVEVALKLAQTLRRACSEGGASRFSGAEFLRIAVALPGVFL